MCIERSLGKFVRLLIPCSILFAACAPEQTPEPSAVTPEQMFMESCGGCHTREDNGPSIADLRALSADELRVGISNHPTAGDIPDRLSAARIDELIKYLEE